MQQLIESFDRGKEYWPPIDTNEAQTKEQKRKTKQNKAQQSCRNIELWMKPAN